MRTKRTAAIDEIIDARNSSGNAIGIFGVEACQVCGQAGSFSGWAGAMKSHPQGVFVATGHRHEEPDVDAALREGAPRFCSVCTRPASRRLNESGIREEGPLCERCLADGVTAGRVARFRYLDERHPSLDDLLSVLERTERTLILTDTAPSREIALARLAMRRWLRPLRHLLVRARARRVAR